MSDASDEEFQEFLRNGGNKIDENENLENTNPEDTTTGKEAGNRCFKEGSFSEAIKHWATSLRSCEYIINKGVFDGDKLKEILDLRKTLWANLSVGHLKLREFAECVKYCDRVLREEAENVKVLFRKSSAFYEMGEFKQAKDVINQLLTLDPNAAVKQLSVKVEAALLKYEARSRKMMASVFSKLESDKRTDEAELREENGMEIHEVIGKRVKRFWKSRGYDNFLDENLNPIPIGNQMIDGTICKAYSFDLTPGKYLAKGFHLLCKVLSDSSTCCKRRKSID